MNTSEVVFVAGSRGLVGQALVRALRELGYANLLVPDRSELDLSEPAATAAWFAEHRPDVVFLAAAKVGGIYANSTYPADFIRENLLIQTAVIDAAHRNQVRKLVFLGSSCLYPRECPQPMKEEYLLSGPMEPTNQWYAIAKISGIKMCQAYRRQHGFNAITLMPTNMYGPGDNFHLDNAHVLPTLIRKFHEGRDRGGPVTLWGTGTPRREFLHVDDLAHAAIFLARDYEDEEIINVGWGQDISIAELATLVAEVTGYDGEILYDATRPDGVPRKLLDTSRLRELGWAPRIGLREGIERTYAWFVDNADSFRQ